MITNSGKGLIFLISQPRAGSTLLQRILGSHSEVQTTAEPWIMLPPLYGLHRDGIQAEFDWFLAQNAIGDFLSNIPNQEQVYFSGMRKMYRYIYQQVLNISGKEFFLDKTPRYYLVIQELYKTFPDAHYIFLLRNPLAVLNSLIETWTEFQLWRYKQDIVSAPSLLLEGIELVGDRGFTVNYEELVSDAEKISVKICNFLGIDFQTEILTYRKDTNDAWSFGDKESINDHQEPVKDKIDKWEKSLQNPINWRLAHDYLEILGSDTVSQMGYSYDDLLKTITVHAPSPILKMCVPSLLWWVNRKYQNPQRIRFLARFRKSLRKQGVWTTIKKTGNYLQRKI